MVTGCTGDALPLLSACWTIPAEDQLLTSPAVPKRDSNPCFHSATRFRIGRMKLGAVDSTPESSGQKPLVIYVPSRSESHEFSQPRLELRGLGTSWEPQGQFPGQLGVGPKFSGGPRCRHPFGGCKGALCSDGNNLPRWSSVFGCCSRHRRGSVPCYAAVL